VTGNVPFFHLSERCGNNIFKKTCNQVQMLVSIMSKYSQSCTFLGGGLNFGLLQVSIRCVMQKDGMAGSCALVTCMILECKNIWAYYIHCLQIYLVSVCVYSTLSDQQITKILLWQVAHVC